MLIDMKKILLLLILTSILTAQEKVLTLKKIDQEIKIDGIIDDVWSEADSVSDFVQYQPYHNNLPSRKTTAKVLTTEGSIYALMICYSQRDEMDIKTGKLDDFAGDIVSFMIDTFNDKKTGYKFAVSASGVRADSRMLDDGRNRDNYLIVFGKKQLSDGAIISGVKSLYRAVPKLKKYLQYKVVDNKRVTLKFCKKMGLYYIQLRPMFDKTLSDLNNPPSETPGSNGPIKIGSGAASKTTANGTNNYINMGTRFQGAICDGTGGNRLNSPNNTDLSPGQRHGIGLDNKISGLDNKISERISGLESKIDKLLETMIKK